jgi:selenocysteine lyase/cysteine desulfurase
MFNPVASDAAIAAAERITPAYLEQTLAGYVDCELITDDERRAIIAALAPLIALIRDQSLQGEDFWRAFQRQFGFATAAAKVTPMNAANLCPEPTALINAASILRLSYNNNVAQQVRTAGGVRVDQLKFVREYLAKGLGIADPEDLALIRNSSEGNNAISAGFTKWKIPSDTQALDTVVVWAENHPTNLEAWRLRRDHNKSARPRNDEPQAGDPFQLIVVSFDKDADEEAIADAFISKIDARTRFITYSETSNGSGTRIPESAIAAIWTHIQRNNYDCHVHIDGTMAWGARPVNLGNPFCHSFVSSAHKWFLGPKETAVLYMTKEKVQNFVPSIFAYDYKITIGDWDKMPKTALRFELLGQRDDVNLITLQWTQMIWTLLVASRDPHTRVAHLSTMLIDSLRKSNWKFKTPSDPKMRWGIVRVEAGKGPEAPSLYDWIYQTQRAYRFGGSGGSESAKEQTFRLCPHIYNTKDDIDAVVAAMNEWRRLYPAP